MLQVASNDAVRIVAVRTLHEAFVDAVLGGHGELRAHGGVAAVAQLVLLLREQVFRRGRMVDRVATGAGHVVLRVLGAVDIRAFEVARVAPRQVSSACFGCISENACGMVVLPPPAATCALAGPWQPSQPVLFRRFLAGGDALEVRILVEVDATRRHGRSCRRCCRQSPRRGGGRSRLVCATAAGDQQQQQQYSHDPEQSPLVRITSIITEGRGRTGGTGG